MVEEVNKSVWWIWKCLHGPVFSLWLLLDILFVTGLPHNTSFSPRTHELMAFSRGAWWSRAQWVRRCFLLFRKLTPVSLMVCVTTCGPPRSQRALWHWKDTKYLVLVWPDPVGRDEHVYISVVPRGHCGLVLGPQGRSGWPPQEPGVLRLWPGARNRLRGACGIQKKNVR